MNMKHTLTIIFAIFIFSGAHAANTPDREQFVQQIGLALANGQCSAVLMKERQITATPGHYISHYISDRQKLHQCQYVQEMIVSPCVKLKTCPSYTTWSENNPDFSPALPRDKFEKMLDSRQAMVSALRKAKSTANYE